jgi:flagellar motor component MotA
MAEQLVMTGAVTGVTVSINTVEDDPEAFVALMGTALVPAVVGMPVMAPVVALNKSPVGNKRAL